MVICPSGMVSFFLWAVKMVVDIVVDSNPTSGFHCLLCSLCIVGYGRRALGLIDIIFYFEWPPPPTNMANWLLLTLMYQQHCFWSTFRFDFRWRNRQSSNYSEMEPAMPLLLAASHNVGRQKKKTRASKLGKFSRQHIAHACLSISTCYYRLRMLLCYSMCAHDFVKAAASRRLTAHNHRRW